jgi:non-canonical (house-cleaning) NTP pyrophosphatase
VTEPLVRDSVIDAKIRAAEEAAERTAQEIVEAHIREKYPDKPFDLAVKCAIAYSIIWKGTQK